MGIVSPLLFHPSAKGSQIIMDMAQRTVKRQASFCNAITFSNRPIALYEQVRLKVRPQELQLVMGSVKALSVIPTPPNETKCANTIKFGDNGEKIDNSK